MGNKRLRVLASNFLSQYSEANEKKTKTRVVNDIIDSIKSAGGSFVKKETNGRWSHVSEQAIREKIGYVFRDLLSDKYRSSSKSKAVRRRKEQFGRASLKLERAMRHAYPTLQTLPKSSFIVDPIVSAEDEDKIRPSFPRMGLTRIVSDEEVLQPQEVPSAILQCETRDRIGIWLDSYHNGYDVDELMSSPLIFPDE